MKGAGWIGFVAARYVSRGRKNSPSPVFSVLGIATGVLALIVIISVMNGFQLGFIESILEISSCHLRLDGIPYEDVDELCEIIRPFPEVVSVLPFKEINLLLRGMHTNPRGALVRGVPADALYLDPGLAGRLEFEGGFFDLYDPNNIILGIELARHLSVWIGDELNLLSIIGGIQDDTDGGSQTYTVSGIFHSGFYEYDLGWGYVNMETAMKLSGVSTDLHEETEMPSGSTVILGIKLKNRWQDQQAMDVIRKALASSGIQVSITEPHGSENSPHKREEEEGGIFLSSWRDYNRAFFSALRTEKLMMFILVGLIFIVVGLNIFQAQRRTVLERREEIGLLRALGASDIAVRLVFVWDGFIIGLLGAGLGLALGLPIAYNIPGFFSFLEWVINNLIFTINGITNRLGINAGAEEFAVFSPRIFYIKEIPSRVIPLEVVFTFLFGFLSALLAAWFASGKVSGARPAEVLRYE